MTIAILPASGKAQRFGGIPKFLLPVLPDGRSLIDIQVDSLVGLVDEVVITAPRTIIRVLESRRSSWSKRLKVHLFACEPSTMPDAFLQGTSLFPNENYVCLFPDTFFDNSLANGKQPISTLLSASNMDPSTLRLALWRITPDQFGQLGQIEFDFASNRVLKVRDKVPDCKLGLAWGAFYFPNHYLKLIENSDQHMGQCFTRAISVDFPVKGVVVQGRYWDVADMAKYFSLLSMLNKENETKSGSNKH